jgi:hypothetical protein
VDCAVVRVDDPKHLVFDVVVRGWARWRWREIVVPGGPLLGLPADVRRAVLWDGEGRADVVVGRRTEAGWEVRAGDVVEPLPGTLVALYGGDARTDRALAYLAVKELVRERLRTGLGREVHPRGIELMELRPDLWLVTAVPALRADEYVAHLHPTRFTVETASRDGACEAVAGGGVGGEQERRS